MSQILYVLIVPTIAFTALLLAASFAPTAKKSHA